MRLQHTDLKGHDMIPTEHPYLILFNFDQPADAQLWRSVDDGIMGGVSWSQFQIEDNRIAVFSGVVSRENNGGFASIRSRPYRMDLRAFDGLDLRVRGDGKQYQLRICDNPSFDGIAYAAYFTTQAAEWQIVRISFKDFAPRFRGRTLSNVAPLNSGMIRSFGFLIGKKQAGSFRLEIDWLRAYKET